MASDRAQILITAVDQTRTALDSIRNNLGRLGDETRRVQGLLAGLGVSLTLGAFAALVKGAIDSADELNKLSQKIGISVEALSTLQFAAQLSDVGLECWAGYPEDRPERTLRQPDGGAGRTW
jgi:hypothetical protein